jgi:DNA-binding NtrC family response regulator
MKKPRGRVLVVDDDPNQRMSLESILALDHDVTAAAGVAEALRLMQEEVFDVVVTDFEMPDGTGADLLHAVEKAGRAMSMILITGHSEYATVRDLQKSGKALVLFKPVDPKELLGWIRNGVTMARLSAATSNLQKRAGDPPSERLKRPPGDPRTGAP